jgi:acyl carrier protein
MTKQELFDHLVSILNETFDIETACVKLESRLFEDLDIDSIDAVDLLVKLKPIVGKRLQPDAFKSVRTIRDVVDAVHGLLDGASPA